MTTPGPIPPPGQWGGGLTRKILGRRSELRVDHVAFTFIDKNQALIGVRSSNLSKLAETRNLGGELSEFAITVYRLAHVVASGPQGAGSAICTGVRVKFALVFVSKRRPI